MRLPLIAVALALSSCAPQSPYLAEDGEHAITLSKAGRPLVRFQKVPQVPEDVDPVYARAGYLHPIFTPSGAVVTGDYCASHRHQHGVFFAWTRTRFEGREIDFWNAAERQGRIELLELVACGVDDDYAGFETMLAYQDISLPGVVRTALEENWRVRAHSSGDATVIDLVSRQFAVTSPLTVLEYHYGGFAFRGPEAWLGVDGARVITSAGLDRIEGNKSRARWVAMSGIVSGGREATIAVLSSAHNPRAPEAVRIHPSLPYFCFAACQQGEFEIERGAPRETHYRIVAMDGAPNVARLDELWQEFSAGGKQERTASTGNTAPDER